MCTRVVDHCAVQEPELPNESMPETQAKVTIDAEARKESRDLQGGSSDFKPAVTSSRRSTPRANRGLDIVAFDRLYYPSRTGLYSYRRVSSSPGRQSSHAASTIGPMEERLRAIEKFLACWKWRSLGSRKSTSPFVKSVRAKCHKVVIGYPDNPRRWRTKCGWQFGVSDVARPVHKLPVCHKAICETCFKTEKEAARAEAEYAC